MDPDPNDDFMRCNQGHIHWGLGGAAGLMLHHQDENGTHRYLMQQRSPYVQHGGTWAPPSGALNTGEHPIAGAVREAQEELGPFQSTNHEVAHVNDHGGWAFHTVTGDSPTMFDPQDADWTEASDHAWLTPEEIDEMPLHPGFKESWNDLRPQPKQKFAAWHAAPQSARDQILQHGLDSSKGRALNPGVPRGTYFFESPDDARWYQGGSEDHFGEPFDMWDVNTEDYDVREDPTNPGYPASYVPHPIPADRLNLVPNDPLPGERWPDYTKPEYRTTAGETGEVVGPEEPGEAQGNPVIDHLTLSSVAHNLHYKAEKTPLSAQEAHEYAGRLLDMMGYRNPDPMMVGAAVQAWQTLYPSDQQLASGPEIQGELQAPATEPTDSWGYGTTAAVTRDEFGQPSIEEWEPGNWGKGLMIGEQPHVWQTEGPGGSPHHYQYMRLIGREPDWEMNENIPTDAVTVAPDGSYTTDEWRQGILDPSVYARMRPGMRYVRDPDKWNMRAFGSAPPEPPNFREGSDAEHCGNCKMFSAGKCWGYGNKLVGADDVCDSWAKETRTSSVRKADFYDDAMQRAYGMPNAMNAFNAADQWLNYSVPQQHQQEIHNDAHYYMGSNAVNTWPDAYHEALRANAEVNKYSANPDELHQHLTSELPLDDPQGLLDKPGEATQEPPEPQAPRNPLAHHGQIPGDEEFDYPVENMQINPNAGINPSFTGTVNDKPVYVKPEGQFHENDLAHERAAFAVARAMGVPMPHTTTQIVSYPGDVSGRYSPIENRPAQVIHSVGGNSLASEVGGPFSHQQAMGGGPEDEARLKQIALLDNVIGNSDRHLGNVVRGEDGGLYPIDHGGAFGFSPNHADDDFELGGIGLTPEELEAVQRAKGVDVRDMGVDHDRWQAMQGRIQKLLDSRMRLAPPSNPW